MQGKNLAIIMAAGYGRRMGKIEVPKVMLKDGNGRPLIEDAMTFLRFKGDQIDFAVLSREEKFFDSLNEYLRSHSQSDKFDMLYQTIKPKNFHVMALIWEYFRFGTIYKKLNGYESVIILPADHRLSAEDLNLEDLVNKHKENKADLTLVYSEGWNSSSAYRDVLRINAKGKILYLMRVEPNIYNEIGGDIKATSTGVWVLDKKVITNPAKLGLAYLGFKIGTGQLAGFASAVPYFIKPGWGGVRDTPKDLSVEKTIIAN